MKIARQVFWASVFAAALIVSEPARAGWVYGNISEINLINDGSNDGVYVTGSFAAGCTYNGFVIYATDPYFQQVYATLLTAKATGRQVKFMNVYCHSSGYARGNQYAIL